MQPKLKKPKRMELILQELLQKKRISADELSRTLGVNASTIRRDLEELERKNLLRRTHGGAIPIDILSFSGYSLGMTIKENMGRWMSEKTAIALEASKLVQAGDTIALSPGSTTTLLAQTIRRLQIPKLTVVTNAVNIAMELAGLPNLTMVVIGGLLLSDFFALAGPIAEQSLAQMFVDKAFMGVTGISLKHGLSGPNQLEALTHRATIKQARQVILLADHSKLERVALYHIAPLQQAYILITDNGASPSLVKEYADRGIDMRLA